MIATTFPGKHGDLLWSLPTVKELAKIYGPVDFYMMPQIGGLIPLLEKQSYINSAQALDYWHLITDVPGYQPWQHPILPKPYHKEFALGYKNWPDCFLMDFIAQQAGITLNDPLPFIEVDNEINCDVSIGFSSIYWQYPEYIEKFIDPYKKFLDEQNITWYDVSHVPWIEASEKIKGSKVFIGDKSSLHVLAHGLEKFVIEAESNPDRRTSIFTCYYGKLHTVNNNIINIIDEITEITLKNV